MMTSNPLREGHNSSGVVSGGSGAREEAVRERDEKEERGPGGRGRRERELGKQAFGKVVATPAATVHFLRRGGFRLGFRQGFRWVSEVSFLFIDIC